MGFDQNTDLEHLSKKQASKPKKDKESTKDIEMSLTGINTMNKETKQKMDRI